MIRKMLLPLMAIAGVASPIIAAPATAQVVRVQYYDGYNGYNGYGYRNNYYNDRYYDRGYDGYRRGHFDRYRRHHKKWRHDNGRHYGQYRRDYYRY